MHHMLALSGCGILNVAMIYKQWHWDIMNMKFVFLSRDCVLDQH